MTMTKEQLRQKYPLTVYPENCWEIYDEVDARIVAVFYREDDAHQYLQWKNAANGAVTEKDSADE